jgi:predicted dehydrogenase
MTGHHSYESIAVVGYGYWGSKHVRVLNGLPDVELTILDDSDERLADAAVHAPNARLAKRLDDVLDSLDAAVIATPPGSHAGLALRVLRAGKHALVEKPLTTAVEDAELLVATAAKHGVQLMVGHTFEYNAAVWKLREIVQSGTLGRVLYIDTQRLSLGRYQSDVNVIWDLAPHDISIASYVIDDMPTSTSVWSQRNLGLPHADVAYVRLDFERARTHAVVHVSWLSPNKVRRVTVVGDRKMVIYDDLSDSERIRIYDIGVDPAEVDEPARAQAMPVTYRTGDIIAPYVPFREPLLVQDEHFLDCIRDGVECRTPGTRGLDVVRVLTSTDDARADGQPSRPFSHPSDPLARRSAVSARSSEATRSAISPQSDRRHTGGLQPYPA